jgi:hypothetical protein
MATSRKARADQPQLRLEAAMPGRGQLELRADRRFREREHLIVHWR